MKSIFTSLITFGMISVSTQAATVVSDFSNFSESGNLLPSPNTRGQDFTPGTSPNETRVTVTWDNSGTGVGQETFLSDEFPTLTVGDRISVDLLSGGDFNNGNDSVGLSVASTETPTSRQNLLSWYWIPGIISPTTATLQAATFDGDGNYNYLRLSGVTTPETLFIERTASGWSFGSIRSSVETVHFADITSMNGSTSGAVSITANGSAIGLYSDMRTDTSTGTVDNFTVIPEPSSLCLSYLALGAMAFRRRHRG